MTKYSDLFNFTLGDIGYYEYFQGDIKSKIENYLKNESEEAIKESLLLQSQQMEKNE